MSLLEDLRLVLYLEGSVFLFGGEQIISWRGIGRGLM